MGRTIEEIAAKMDALGLWEGVAQCNWALCPRGTVFPYFCTAIAESAGPARIRFMMVEGWQTFHDFVRVCRQGQLGRVGPEDPASSMRVLVELDILNAYERTRAYYLNIAETLAGGKR